VPPTKYECDYCDEKFDHAPNLQRHRKDKHVAQILDDMTKAQELSRKVKREARDDSVPPTSGASGTQLAPTAAKRGRLNAERKLAPSGSSAPTPTNVKRQPVVPPLVKTDTRVQPPQASSTPLKAPVSDTVKRTNELGKATATSQPTTAKSSHPPATKHNVKPDVTALKNVPMLAQTKLPAVAATPGSKPAEPKSSIAPPAIITKSLAPTKTSSIMLAKCAYPKCNEAFASNKLLTKHFLAAHSTGANVPNAVIKTAPSANKSVVTTGGGAQSKERKVKKS
jgi:hypothetical protein